MFGFKVIGQVNLVHAALSLWTKSIGIAAFDEWRSRYMARFRPGVAFKSRDQWA